MNGGTIMWWGWRLDDVTGEEFITDASPVAWEQVQRLVHGPVEALGEVQWVTNQFEKSSVTNFHSSIL